MTRALGDLSGQRCQQIGSPSPRVDAYDKVAGRTKFAADHYGDNVLWVAVKRAGVPHARLGEIHTTRAASLPGVFKILTHKDVQGTNRQGVVRRDQPVLVDDKIRHCGDPVALIIANNREAVAQAAALIDVEFDLLPSVFDSQKAIEKGVPLIHEDNPTGNILLKGDLEIGSGDAAKGGCDAIVEGFFETQRQEHAYLETETGWAHCDNDGKLVIVCSTQTPFRDRMEIAEALAVDPESIRIIVPYVGGAFGGKDGVTVQSLLGLAALHAEGRPVKMWWNREESFLAGVKRHPAKMYYRLGAKSNGSLHFLDVQIYLDTGPYDHLGGVVLTLALEHAGGPYRIPNAVLRGWSVYTNNPIGGALRGFGVTQVTAAMEQMMDILACRLNIDPLELRLMNALNRGDKNCVGTTLTGSTGLTDCLESLSKHQLWKTRKKWKSSPGLFKRRGVGIASVMQACGYGPVVPDYANAKIELTAEGTLKVYCGVVDMGQGNASANLQIVSAILGQDPHRIELVQPDTDLTLPSGSASASRCTFTFGNALIGAAQTLRDRILHKTCDLTMSESAKTFVLVPGGVRDVLTGKEITLERIARLLNASERVAVYHFRAPTAPDKVTSDQALRLHGMPHCIFSYGVHLAFIELDELTGSVEVCNYLSVTDAGKVINTQAYDQQIHGAIAQGLGLALMEDLEVRDGRIQTHNYATYLIPTSMDIPHIESVAVEIFEPAGPFGMKGVGEISINGPTPVIANALADACGIRLNKSPFTAERLLDALHDKLDDGGAPCD